MGWIVTAASFLMFTVSTGTLGVFVLLYIYFEREFLDSATAIGKRLRHGCVKKAAFVIQESYDFEG